MSEGRTTVWQPRNVTTIPATIRPLSQMPLYGTRKRRVAAYARVSTDSEEQQTSYEAQVDYYTRYITGKPDEWEFVRVYTDEGISATNTKRRDGFNSMVQDALDGKIDLIITKSVSRFARNTVDSLTTVRMLKEKGVEVFFEKENIYTLDSKGELLITIMSSLAQEESRSISENVTWGLHKRFADGKVTLPYKRFLGYRKGENGLPEIVEEEAKVVRRIYASFLDGQPVSAIAKQLTSEEVLTPSGGKKWSASTVESILTNEKYKGAAILQKTFTVDFLMKKTKVNEGEVPMYYVENSHPAIIPPEVFDLVQDEMRKRRGEAKYRHGASCFAGMIVCGDCGGFYGSKVWHSNDPYRCVIWRCNRKYDGEKKCSTPHVREEDVKVAFIKAINDKLTCKDAVLSGAKAALAAVMDMSALDADVQRIREQLLGVAHQMKECIDRNARSVQDQEAFDREYGALETRCAELKLRQQSAEFRRNELQSRKREIDTYIKALQDNGGIVTQFDEGLWRATVERIVIGVDGKIDLILKVE